MIHRLAIDFKAAAYRSAIRQLRMAANGGGWSQVQQRGLLFNNWRQAAGSVGDCSSAKRVHYVGFESDEDIQRFFESEMAAETREAILVVTLRRENLYRFSTDVLDRVNVIFILDFVPGSLEERYQLFNLFHKSLMMRQVGAFLYYYSRVVNMLTSAEPLPAEPPDLPQSLGARSLLYQIGVLRDRIWLKFDLFHRNAKRLASANARKIENRPLKECRHALITGWYGTETVGDRAILQEVIHVLRERAPGIRISISSIVPRLSKLTNLELRIDAEILELRNLDYRHLESVDLVVFGGGPLMDSSQLRYIETLFAWARARNVATLVFGCGVGPLKTKSGMERTQSILRNSDHAFFRDERSAALAQQLGFSGPTLFACDPAMRYVERWREQQVMNPAVNSDQQLVMLLRAQTGEYSENAASESASLLEEVIGLIRKSWNENAEQQVVMLPMHTFWFGNDDRDFNRKITSGFPAGTALRAFNAPLLLDSLLEELSRAAWGLPMRFHGHIFMLALNIPFVSIDYTGPEGKVGNLIQRYGLEDFAVSTADGIRPGELESKWAIMQARSEDIRALMRKQFRMDLLNLEAIYDRIFGAMSGDEAA